MNECQFSSKDQFAINVAIPFPISLGGVGPSLMIIYVGDKFLLAFILYFIRCGSWRKKECFSVGYFVSSVQYLVRKIKILSCEMSENALKDS